jgi:hypothetical protein
MLLGFVFICIEVSQVQNAVPMSTVAIKIQVGWRNVCGAKGFILESALRVQVVLIEVAIFVIEIWC